LPLLWWFLSRLMRDLPVVEVMILVFLVFRTAPRGSPSVLNRSRKYPTSWLLNL
jgi:hypothetical protein